MALYHILPGEGFLPRLARGLLTRHGTRLSGCTLLLPTRRACRELEQLLFVMAGKEALLMPQLQPLDDMDGLFLIKQGVAAASVAQLPPLLTNEQAAQWQAEMVQSWAKLQGLAPSVMEQHALAESLGTLLDQAARDEVPVAKLIPYLPDVASDAAELQLSLLREVAKIWPQRQAGEGWALPWTQRHATQRLLAAHWQEHPPQAPVILAGSTGAVAGHAALMAAIGRSKHGALVLPGTDETMADAAWQMLPRAADGAQHPQAALATLMATHGWKREDISHWCAEEDSTELMRERVAMLRDALRIAETPMADKAYSTHAFEGLQTMAAKSRMEEAQAIAALVDQALEKGAANALIITEEAAFIPLLEAALAQHGRALDTPFVPHWGETPEGVILLHAIALLVMEEAPEAILALLSHPAQPHFNDEATRWLERDILRQRRAPPGVAGLMTLIERHDTANPPPVPLTAMLSTLAQALRRELSPPENLPRWAQQLLAVFEAFCPATAMKKDLTEQLQSWLTGWLQCYPALTRNDAAQLLDAALQGMDAKRTPAAHTAIRALPAREGRLLGADLVVLANMEEGGWPAAEEAPWLNRRMRAETGLANPDHVIGLAALDFTMLAAQPFVIMTRSLQVDGQIRLPSRFLARVNLAARTAGLEALPCITPPRPSWHDAGEDNHQPFMEKAAACPPLAARPTEFSVTEIDGWRQNPYGFYAKRVLGLKKLKPVNPPLDTAEKGSLLHRLLEDYTHWRNDQTSPPLPTTAHSRMLQLWDKQITRRQLAASDATLIQLELQAVLPLFIALDEEARALYPTVLPERKMQRDLQHEGSTYSLKGVADRVESGAKITRIVDYKTGRAPYQSELKNGTALQLPLLLWLMQAEHPNQTAWHAAYWQVMKKQKEEICPTMPEEDAWPELIRQAMEHLEALIDRYAQPDQPYESCPDPENLPKYNDYAHLAREKQA